MGAAHPRPRAACPSAARRRPGEAQRAPGGPRGRRGETKRGGRGGQGGGGGGGKRRELELARRPAGGRPGALQRPAPVEGGGGRRAVRARRGGSSTPRTG